MATASVTIPEWLIPIRDSLAKPQSDQSRFEIVSKIYQILSFDSFPSPGEAKPFKVREWRDWAKEHDFIEQKEQQTHSFAFNYRLIPDLFLSIPKTTSDYLSAMRSATEFRAMARGHFNLMSVILNWVLQPANIGMLNFIITPDNLASALRKSYNDRATRDQLLKRATEEAPDNSVVESGQMKGLLKRFMDDFNMTPKKVFMGIGLTAQEAETLADAYRLSNGTSPLPMSTIGNAKDLFESLHEQAEEEREQKRRDREAKESAKLTARVVAELPSTKFKQRMETVKNALISNHDNMQRIANDAMARITHLGAAIKGINFELPEGFDDFYANQEKLTAAQERIAAMEKEAMEKDQRIASLEADAREHNELIKLADATSPFKDRLEAMCKLVTTKLASGDVFVLIPAISEVKKKAEDELATLAKPS